MLSHCCMSARSGPVSGVSSAASLLLSVAAAVASAGSAAVARRFGVGVASSGTVIEAITASRRCVAKVQSPEQVGAGVG